MGFFFSEKSAVEWWKQRSMWGIFSLYLDEKCLIRSRCSVLDWDHTEAHLDLRRVSAITEETYRLSSGRQQQVVLHKPPDTQFLCLQANTASHDWPLPSFSVASTWKGELKEKLSLATIMTSIWESFAASLPQRESINLWGAVVSKVMLWEQVEITGQWWSFYGLVLFIGHRWQELGRTVEYTNITHRKRYVNTDSC